MAQVAGLPAGFFADFLAAVAYLPEPVGRRGLLELLMSLNDGLQFVVFGFEDGVFCAQVCNLSFEAGDFHLMDGFHFADFRCQFFCLCYRLLQLLE